VNEDVPAYKMKFLGRSFQKYNIGLSMILTKLQFLLSIYAGRTDRQTDTDATERITTPHLRVVIERHLL